MNFDDEFLDRRLAEHRAWQELHTQQLCNDVLDDLGFTRPPAQLDLLRHKFPPAQGFKVGQRTAPDGVGLYSIASGNSRRRAVPIKLEDPPHAI